MLEEASLEFRLSKIDETRNYLLDEIKHRGLMSEKHKKACKYLNYIEHFLILALTITGCVLISALPSFVNILVDITSSAVGINTCPIAAGLKKYKSIIKKKKKKHNKIVLLGKDKINTIEVLISKSLIDSYISHEEFVSVNNVLRENNETKKN